MMHLRVHGISQPEQQTVYEYKPEDVMKEAISQARGSRGTCQ